MGGIFTLTAMMNHSCEPNAEIRGGEYVDCNIDIVAKRDIRCGEEITISYLNLGSQNSHDQTSNSIIGRNRRRKELSSRYLFSCQCTRCCKSM
jgi:SET domain-containing protein